MDSHHGTWLAKQLLTMHVTLFGGNVEGTCQEQGQCLCTMFLKCELYDCNEH